MFFHADELAVIDKLKRISSELQVSYAGGEILFSRQGIKFEIFLFPQAKASGSGLRIAAPAFFQIKTKIPHQHESFSIRKSDTLDWVSEHIFFNPDYQTGDGLYDSKFFITVKNRAWGNILFDNENIRLGISNILRGGFHRVYSEDNYLKADWFIKNSDECPSIELINDAIEQLGKIIINFPSKWFVGHQFS